MAVRPGCRFPQTACGVGLAGAGGRCAGRRAGRMIGAGGCAPSWVSMPGRPSWCHTSTRTSVGHPEDLLAGHRDRMARRGVARASPWGLCGCRSSAAGPSLEFEAMLKVAFADLGSRDDLIARLTEIAELTLTIGATIAEQYLAGQGSFPDRLHISRPGLTVHARPPRRDPRRGPLGPDRGQRLARYPTSTRRGAGRIHPVPAHAAAVVIDDGQSRRCGGRTSRRPGSSAASAPDCSRAAWPWTTRGEDLR